MSYRLKLQFLEPLLLDDILKIPSGQLVTYELLEEIGIDSVEIEKVEDNIFAIYFKELDSYEDFAEQYNLS